jgi:IS5 family transposase
MVNGPRQCGKTAMVREFASETRRTTQHAGYRISQKKRKRIEECFGWLKTIALLRKVRYRGTLKVDWILTFACAAYNLVHMRNLMHSAVPT